jgi:hypothetical protein
MTLRDPNYMTRPLSAHASALLSALREAGADGLPEARVKELGGRHWDGVLRRLCRWHAVGEERGVYYLVNGVQDARGESRDGASYSSPSRSDATTSTGVLNTDRQPTLFDSPGSSSHYDLLGEAA